MQSGGEKTEKTFDEIISEFRKIEGIGIQRAKNLYNAGYRSIEALQSASVEELAKVPKIGLAAAKKIKANVDLFLKKKTVKCPDCGATNELPAENCYLCGALLKLVREVPKIIERKVEEIKEEAEVAEVEAVGVPCPECATPNPDGARICYACGASLVKIEVLPEVEKKAPPEEKIELIPVPPPTEGIKPPLEEELAELAKPELPEIKTEFLQTIEKGHLYLIDEDPPLLTYEIFNEFTSYYNLNGLCITRSFPSKARRKYKLAEKIPIVWLSNVTDEYAIRPTDVEKLSVTVQKFAESGAGAILLDGLDYLISQNGFETALKFVQFLRETIAINNLTGFMPFDKNVVDKQQLSILKKETEVLDISAIAVKEVVEKPVEVEKALPEAVPAPPTIPPPPPPIPPSRPLRAVPRRSYGKIGLLSLVVALILFFSVLLVGFRAPVPEKELIEIDGSFADWTAVLRYSDKSDIVSDINIVEYATFESKAKISFYLKVNGIMMGRHSIKGVNETTVFIDADSNWKNGYSVLGLGADYMLKVTGWNNSISAAYVYRFESEDLYNWSGWKRIGRFKAALGTNELEMQVSKEIVKVSTMNAYRALFHTKDSNGNEDYSEAIISTARGALVVEQKTYIENDILKKGIDERVLRLDLHAKGTAITVSNIDFELEGIETHNIKLSEKIPITIKAGTTKTVNVSANTIPIASRSFVKVGVNVSGIKINSGTITLRGLSATAYVELAKERIAIDGAFADWHRLGYKFDTLNDVPNQNIDLAGYNATTFTETENAIAFYLEVGKDARFFAGISPYLPARPVTKPAVGPGVTVIRRVSGEDYSAIYIDADCTIFTGEFVQGIGADYKIEIRGIYGKITSSKYYRYDTNWVDVREVIAKNDYTRIETEIGFADLNITDFTGREIKIVFVTTDWTNNRDYTGLMLSQDTVGELYYYHGRSQISFEATEYNLGSVGSAIQSIALADLDNDGDLDIVTGNSNKEIHIWKNQLPVFNTVYVATVGGIPYGLATADIDNDGDIDIISGDDGKKLYILKNDYNADRNPWNGGWAITSLTTAKRIYRVAAGDLDNDGDLDIVAGVEDPGLYGFENNPVGTINAPVTLTDLGGSGAKAYSLALGDVDNNGLLDVFAGEDGEMNVDLWQNNGNPFGGPVARVEVDVNTGKDVYGIALADLNRDGLLDFIYAGFDGTDYCVWLVLNDGTPFTGPYTRTKLCTNSNLLKDLIVADFDNDGWLDIAGVDETGLLSVWENLHTFTAWQKAFSDIPAGVSTPTNRLACGDMDNDGDIDILIGDNSGNVFGYENILTHRNYSFEFTNFVGSMDSSIVTSIKTADLDNNATSDIIAGDNSGDLYLFKNPASAWTDNWLRYFVGKLDDAILDIEVADFDKDGLTDIIISELYTGLGDWGRIFALRNPGTPFSSAWSSYEIISFITASAYAIAVADLDNDGDHDIICSKNNQIFALENPLPGSSPWSSWNSYQVDSNEHNIRINAIETTDLNNDCWYDVVSADDLGYVYVWRNNANPFGGAWLSHQIYSSGTTILDVAASDVDIDGDTDIAIATSAGDAILFKNPYEAGNPFSDPWLSKTVGNANNPLNAIELADLDLDSDYDIVGGAIGVYSWQNPMTEGNDVWTASWNVTAFQAVPTIIKTLAVSDLDLRNETNGNDPDIVTGNQSTVGFGGIHIWRNSGAQVTQTVYNLISVDVEFAEGSVNAIFRINIKHNGIVRDKNVRAKVFNFLYTDASGNALTAAQISNLVSNHYICNDTNGDGLFNGIAVDTPLQAVVNLLANGIVGIDVNPSDTNAAIQPLTKKTCFYVIELSATAATASPNSFKISYQPDGFSTNYNELENAQTSKIETIQESTLVSTTTITAIPQFGLEMQLILAITVLFVVLRVKNNLRKLHRRQTNGINR